MDQSLAGVGFLYLDQCAKQGWHLWRRVFSCWKDLIWAQKMKMLYFLNFIGPRHGAVFH